MTTCSQAGEESGRYWVPPASGDENGGTPGGATCANERFALSWVQAPALQSPLPTPLDSGESRND